MEAFGKEEEELHPD